MSTLGDKRREQILGTLTSADAPTSGAALAAATGVSRQVFVQDIASLRSQGWTIQSTFRGYVI